jgi:hypothetical protein
MHATARLRVAASVFVIAIAAACGSDSTGPSQSPPSVAARFDSLYVDASDRSDGDNAFGIRATLLTLFEVPPAVGASPSSISVTTASGVEHWKAFEFDELLTPTDSGFTLVAYRESAAHTVLVIQYEGDGSVFFGLMLTNDTLPVDISSGGGSTKLSSTSSSCGTPSSSLVNPQLDSLAFSSCALANFRTSLSLTTLAAAHVDPALARIDIDAATVNGIRVVDAEEAGMVRRVRAALRAAHITKRL